MNKRPEASIGACGNQGTIATRDTLLCKISIIVMSVLLTFEITAYILGKGWSREQLAKNLGTESTTVKKWFKEAGLPAGKAGRPKKKSNA